MLDAGDGDALSPVRFYLQLQLKRAEHLLTCTRMSVLDVGPAFRVLLSVGILTTLQRPARPCGGPDAAGRVGGRFGLDLARARCPLLLGMEPLRAAGRWSRGKSFETSGG